MIGSDERMAVVYECWFALRESYLYTPDSSGPKGGRRIGRSSCVGNWNYIGSDPNAFEKVKDIVGVANRSVAAAPECSVEDEYGLKGGIGRGGQCTYFSSLILYRALEGRQFHTGNNQHTFRWADLDLNRYRYSATEAQPGDLVFTKKGVQHIAVCVANPGNGTIEVVDSNFIGSTDSSFSVGTFVTKDNQGNRKIIHCSEIIGRRTLDARRDEYYLITGDTKKHKELRHERWYNRDR